MSVACEAFVERLFSDHEFRRQFQSDREASLRSFALSEQERLDLMNFDVSSLPVSGLRRRMATTVCAMKGGLGE